MPIWPNSGKFLWCRWCGEAIPKVIDGRKSSQRLWHPDCLTDYLLHTDGSAQKRHLIKRDGERCALCPEGAAVPTRWQKGSSAYHYPEGYYATDIERVLWLEVDHRTPLWEIADLPDRERIEFFGPDNLWLLCGPHHKEKTKREAGERAALRRKEKKQRALDLK